MPGFTLDLLGPLRLPFYRVSFRSSQHCSERFGSIKIGATSYRDFASLIARVCELRSTVKNEKTSMVFASHYKLRSYVPGSESKEACWFGLLRCAQLESAVLSAVIVIFIAKNLIPVLCVRCSDIFCTDNSVGHIANRAGGR